MRANCIELRGTIAHLVVIYVVVQVAAEDRCAVVGPSGHLALGLLVVTRLLLPQADPDSATQHLLHFVQQNRLASGLCAVELDNARPLSKRTAPQKV